MRGAITPASDHLVFLSVNEIREKSVWLMAGFPFILLFSADLKNQIYKS